MKGRIVLSLFAAVWVWFPSEADAVCRLGLERVVSGLERPVGLAFPPDGSGRMFILEQHVGRMRVFDMANRELLAEPVLELGNLSTGGEQGLLGMAFDPDYASNGRFYVNVTVSNGTTEIRQYSTLSDNPNVVSPRGSRVLLSYSQPFSNHNGGWIDFGPDGHLYIASGDGGSGFDPGNRAQRLDTLLGKMLRIDVDGTDGSTGEYGIPPDNPFVAMEGARPEIWALGLRNPWRNSFDRLTGDLYIGDVGQGEIEEISFQSGDSPGGENYGWRVMEGTLCSDNSQAGGNPPCDSPLFVPPIHEYRHPTGLAVVGGYVYRGQAIPWLRGTYFFADYVTTRIWSFRYDGADVTEFADRTSELDPGRQIGLISSFGEDRQGEIYIVDMDAGAVYRIVTGEEQPAGDLDNDCDVDLADLAILAENWMAGK
jgi:glucose/arabinose dehydrogenase